MKLNEDAARFLQRAASIRGGMLVYDGTPDVGISSLVEAGFMKERLIKSKLTLYEITDRGRSAIASWVLQAQQ